MPRTLVEVDHQQWTTGESQCSSLQLLTVLHHLPIFLLKTGIMILRRIPPATISAVPMHSAVVHHLLVGMGGNFLVHLLTLLFPVRLKSSLELYPPTVVSQPLMTVVRHTLQYSLVDETSCQWLHHKNKSPQYLYSSHTPCCHPQQHYSI